MISEKGFYKNNRKLYIVEAAVEYFISLLITGAFLATVLKQIGVPDSVAGITSALASFGYSAQLVAVLLIRPGKKIKRYITYMHLANQLMFSFLYLIPFICIPSTVKIALFIIMFLGGHLLSHLAMPFKLSYLMGFVDDGSRGKFTANKEIVSLIGGMAFSFLMGWIIDHFKEIGKDETGFILAGITVFILALIHLATLVFTKDDKEKLIFENDEKPSVKNVLEFTLFDKRMNKIILLDIIWHFGSGLSISFFGTYTTNDTELAFSLTAVAIITALGTLSRVFVSRYFGSFADKYGFAKMLTLSFGIGALAFLINSFSSVGIFRYFYVAYTIIYAVFMAGANSGLTNIVFDYTSVSHRSYALGVKSALGGFSGFLASLIGAKILETIQQNGNTLLGFHIYAQQVLSFLTFVVYVVNIIYIKTVIEKMKRE